MAVIKFKLTEQHLRLLKHLRWGINKNNFIVGVEDEMEDQAPFGENSLYEAMDLILNGMPADFSPLDTESVKEYTNEEKAEWDKLYAELPIALELILFNGSFELGEYVARLHDKQWKKI